MNSQLYILLMCAILFFDMIETDDGFMMRKFKEWRDRCRRKFEFFKVIYNFWKLTKNSNLTLFAREDYNLLNHTIYEMTEIDEYFKLRKDPRWNQTFMGRMYNFCSRPMGAYNLTDMLKEIKRINKCKTSAVPASIEIDTREESSSELRLEKMLDTRTKSAFEHLAGFPHTTSTPQSSTERNGKKWTRIKFDKRNENGQLESTVEIHLDRIPHANLSTLIDWLYVIEDMESNIYTLKENGDVEAMKLSFGIVNSDDKRDPEQMIKNTLEFCEDAEKLINDELRKPEKDWNYSKEGN